MDKETMHIMLLGSAERLFRDLVDPNGPYAPVSFVLKRSAQNWLWYVDAYPDYFNINKPKKP